MIRAGRLALALAALSTPAAVVALDPPGPPVASAPAGVLFRIAAEAQAAHVGKGAGLACFPNGKLRLRDFAVSPLVARDTLSAALGEGEGGHLSAVAVTLLGMEGKLCARDYGVFGRGDRQSLSGAVTFRFSWTRPDGATGAAAIRVESDRREAAPPADLFDRALVDLARRIRETS